VTVGVVHNMSGPLADVFDEMMRAAGIASGRFVSLDGD
jgi:hypothetical protein